MINGMRVRWACCFIFVLSVSFLGLRSSERLIDKIVSCYAIYEAPRGMRVENGYYEIILRRDLVEIVLLRSTPWLYHSWGDRPTIITSWIAFSATDHQPTFFAFANKSFLINTIDNVLQAHVLCDIFFFHDVSRWRAENVSQRRKFFLRVRATIRPTCVSITIEEMKWRGS